MPLDLGAGADSDVVAKRAGAQGVHGGVTGLKSLLEAGANIGQALSALREAKGLSLTDIADATCVRRAYLQAIEELNIDQLPSRPFAVGYVKAYAEVLGVDADLAVQQFKTDWPSPDEALKNPVGVHKERDPRLSWLAGVCAVVATAIVIWNLAQHAVARDGKPTPPVAVSSVPAPKPLAAQGPVALAAAQPAPADSDVPQPYVTPGMAKALGGPDAVAAAEPVAAPAKVFLNPRAAVYGAPADKSVVTLKALKSASLVVKGADGSI
jgi:cytoskeletal protein RodZ